MTPCQDVENEVPDVTPGQQHALRAALKKSLKKGRKSKKGPAKKAKGAGKGKKDKAPTLKRKYSQKLDVLRSKKARCTKRGHGTDGACPEDAVPPKGWDDAVPESSEVSGWWDDQWSWGETWQDSWDGAWGETWEDSWDGAEENWDDWSQHYQADAADTTAAKATSHPKPKAKAKASPKAKAKGKPKAKAKAAGKAKASAKGGSKKAVKSGASAPAPESKTKAKGKGAKALKGEAKPAEADDFTPKQGRIYEGRQWRYLVLEDQVFGCKSCRFIYRGCKACQSSTFRGRTADAEREEQQAYLKSQRAGEKAGKKKKTKDCSK